MTAGTLAIVTRAQVLAFRWHAHQLHRNANSARSTTDVALFDLGLQDTGTGGAGWATAVRGAPPPRGDEVALAWTVRGAPHAYRRADLPAVAVASAPLSEADAGKRIFDANRTLKAAGIPAIEALRAVARAQRAIVTVPTVKGELSSRLTDVLAEPYLRECRPCGVIHSYEMTFRMAALQAGLELEAATSPPVLHRIPGMEPPYLSQLGGQAQPQFDVVRGYLRFFAPARVRDVAGFLDAPLRDVKDHWPADAVEVEVSDLPTAGRGEPRFALDSDVEALTGGAVDRPGTVRLLGPFDAYLQLRDRDTLVADPTRSKDLWRMLGRPGAVVVDGEVAGTWRPRASGSKLSLLVDYWGAHDSALDAGVAEQAERFAAFRKLTLTGIDVAG